MRLKSRFLRRICAFRGFILILIFISNGSICYPQTWSVSLAFGDVAVTLYPFSQLLDQTFYPLFQLAAEYQYWGKRGHSLSQTAVFQFYYHRLTGHGLGVKSDVLYRYTFRNGFYPEVQVGFGYVATVPSERQYKPDANGNYTKADPLISRAELSAGLGAGYQWRNRYAIFLRYQYAVQFPYNRKITALPNDILLAGFRLTIATSKKK